ncbi:hypothetical protein HII36_34645 [Nonomuraea sp. NN258]|nr:hypothetical protein [Nonomuraea antri]NRQ36940.1 hypothetical protein [Nonomuraea antri]
MSTYEPEWTSVWDTPTYVSYELGNPFSTLNDSLWSQAEWNGGPGF